jgi:hypothetical protein
VTECAVCGSGGLQSVASCSQCQRPICGHHLIMSASVVTASVTAVDYVRADASRGREQTPGNSEDQRRRFAVEWVRGERRCTECRAQVGYAVVGAEMAAQAAEMSAWLDDMKTLPSKAAEALTVRRAPSLRLLSYHFSTIWSRKGNKPEGEKTMIDADYGHGWFLASETDSWGSGDNYSSSTYSYALSSTGEIWQPLGNRSLIQMLRGPGFEGQAAFDIGGYGGRLDVARYSHSPTSSGAEQRALRKIPSVLRSMISGTYVPPAIRP